MKIVSCSVCFGLCLTSKTVVIENKRVCHSCRKVTNNKNNHGLGNENKL